MKTKIVPVSVVQVPPVKKNWWSHWRVSSPGPTLGKFIKFWSSIGNILRNLLMVSFLLGLLALSVYVLQFSQIQQVALSEEVAPPNTNVSIPEAPSVSVAFGGDISSVASVQNYPAYVAFSEAVQMPQELLNPPVPEGLSDLDFQLALFTQGLFSGNSQQIQDASMWFKQNHPELVGNMVSSLDTVARTAAYSDKTVVFVGNAIYGIEALGDSEIATKLFEDTLKAIAQQANLNSYAPDLAINNDSAAEAMSSSEKNAQVEMLTNTQTFTNPLLVSSDQGDVDTGLVLPLPAVEAATLMPGYAPMTIFMGWRDLYLALQSGSAQISRIYLLHSVQVGPLWIVFFGTSPDMQVPAECLKETATDYFSSLAACTSASSTGWFRFYTYEQPTYAPGEPIELVNILQFLAAFYRHLSD